LVALGVVLIYRSTRVLNFAHGDIATLATFVSFSLLSKGYSFPLALTVSLIVGAAVGVAFYFGVLVKAQREGANLLGMVILTPGLLLDPFFMLDPFLKGFAAAVLGGLNSLPGAVVGAVILGVAESLTGAYLSIQFKNTLAFLIIIVVLLLRPEGLLGKEFKERV